MPSENPNNSQMQILVPNQWTETADPCGQIREKLEEADEEGDPVEGPEVSINLDLRRISETEPSIRQDTWTGIRSLALVEHRTAWCGLSG